jgi:hypothetical protein
MTEQTPAEIAVLRERIANTLDRLEALTIEMKKDREEIHAAVESLRSEIGRYKGFVGGVAFVFSCVIAALSLAKGWLFNERG